MMLMSFNNALGWVGQEVLEEYKNLDHNRGLQGHGHRGVHYEGEGFCGETALEPAGTEGGEGLDDDDNEDEPPETAVCAFLANTLKEGGNRGSWSPFSRGGGRRKRRSSAALSIRRCRLGSS